MGKSNAGIRVLKYLLAVLIIYSLVFYGRSLLYSGGFWNVAVGVILIFIAILIALIVFGEILP